MEEVVTWKALIGISRIPRKTNSFKFSTLCMEVLKRNWCAIGHGRMEVYPIVIALYLHPKAVQQLFWITY
jgi:hypothetical protein